MELEPGGGYLSWSAIAMCEALQNRPLFLAEDVKRLAATILDAINKRCPYEAKASISSRYIWTLGTDDLVDVHTPEGPIKSCRSAADGGWSRCMAAQEYDLASQLLAHAIDVDSSNEYLKVALGYCYMQVGHKENAREQFEGVVKARPTDEYVLTYALASLAHLCALEGDLLSGLEHAESLSKIMPESASSRNLVAWFMLHVGRASEAKSVVESVLDLDPANHDAQILISDAYFALGFEPEAAEILLGLIDAVAGNASWLSIAGTRLLELGMAKEALCAFEEALFLDPDNAKYYLSGVAESHYLLEDWQRAMETYEELATLRPWSDFEAFTWANACIGIQDLEKAEAGIRQLLEERSEGLLLWDALGLVCMSAGKPEEALVAFQEYLKKEANEPAIYFYVGVAHLKLGNLDAAKMRCHYLASMSPLWTKRLALEIEAAEASLLEYSQRPMVPLWCDLERKENNGDFEK
jgi:tetratricopeptide (TPR) repeat protein